MPTATPALEHIDCIFCGPGARSEVLIRENGFEGRQCAACRLIFISPRPSVDQIADLYGHDGAHVPAASHLASGFWKRLCARHSLAILRKYRPGANLLEIGAGAGFFVDEARKQGFSPAAIEFNEIQKAHIEHVLRIQCVSSPLSGKPFQDRVFDVIYHCDVLSHFHDPIGEFKAFHGALREGGILMFETGNLGDVAPRHLRHIDRFQYPDHLFFFSRRNISQILEESGFELLAVHAYSTLPELWTTRLRTWIRKAVRGSTGTAPVAAGAGAGVATPSPPPRPAQTSRLAKLAWGMKAADQLGSYLVKYWIGRIVPRASRPQTLIVVAKRRPSPA
jgi:SAM-dependent methyltransferase